MPCNGSQAVAASQRTADIINIDSRLETDTIPAKIAIVSHIFGGDLRDFASGDVAAVGEIVFHIQRDIIPGHQRTAAVEIAGTYAAIDLRNKNTLFRAVWQRHVLFHQPDHVAG